MRHKPLAGFSVPHHRYVVVLNNPRKNSTAGCVRYLSGPSTRHEFVQLSDAYLFRDATAAESVAEKLGAQAMQYGPHQYEVSHKISLRWVCQLEGYIKQRLIFITTPL